MSALNLSSTTASTGSAPGMINSTSTSTSSDPSNEKQSINNASYDVISLILKQLALPGRVCLGLSCTKFYAYYQTQNPGITSLDEYMCCIISRDSSGEYLIKRCNTRHCRYRYVQLKDLLFKWGGFSGYRRCSRRSKQCRSTYLNVKIYGPERTTFGGKENRLSWRYNDFVWCKKHSDT